MLTRPTYCPLLTCAKTSSWHTRRTSGKEEDPCVVYMTATSSADINFCTHAWACRLGGSGLARSRYSWCEASKSLLFYLWCTAHAKTARSPGWSCSPMGLPIKWLFTERSQSQYIRIVMLQIDVKNVFEQQRQNLRYLIGNFALAQRSWGIKAHRKQAVSRHATAWDTTYRMGTIQFYISPVAGPLRMLYYEQTN